MRLALLVVPVAILAVVLIGVLGDDPSGDAGGSPDSPDDPTAPGRLHIEIGGDAPAPHPTRDAERINRYVLALEKDRGLVEKAAGGPEIDQGAPEKAPQRGAGRSR